MFGDDGVTRELVPHLHSRPSNMGTEFVLAEFYRIWPLVGLTLALVVTVCSMAILGYVAIKLL